MNKAITKYPFIKGVSCEKSIYLNYFLPEAKTSPTLEQEMIMDKGTEVGLLARNLFPEGIDVSQNNTLFGKKLFEATEQALQTDNQVFYEAGFETIDGKQNCKVDILVRCERCTKLIEVKSSTKIKEPEHILDLAFQYYVLTNSNYSGHKVEVYIAYFNKEYVRGEELDVEELFIVENVTRRIQDAQVLIKNHLKHFEILFSRKEEPKVSVSEACFKPYRCSFFEYCWSSMPKTTIFNISRLRKGKLSQMIEEGIIEPHQLPEDMRLTPEQWTEVESYKTGKPIIKKHKIEQFLNSLELNQPTLWMDFETYMSPWPEYKGCKPWQQMPFQYSVLYKDSESIQRREFLAERGIDPRRKFVERLLEDTKEAGNIIVYNQAFEIARMRELAREFPEYQSDIDERIKRIKDLLIPFFRRDYYSPLMNGSTSIKAVLPALVSEEEISYKNLAIKNGAIAMNMYEKFNTLTLKEQIETRRALLEYCYTDTLSMIKIVEALQKIINSNQ